MRVPVAAASLLALVVTLSGASAHAAPLPASASARSLAVRVVYPDGRVDVLAEAVAPPAREVRSGGLNYGDGVVTTGSVWTRARALSDVRADSWGSSTVRSVSLFGGEITIGAVSTKATASATAKGAQGTLSGSWLAEVQIFGEKVRATSNARVQLGDWGYAVLLEQAVVRDSPRIGRRTLVTGIHVYLTKAHGGLPAETEILVGYAEAAASVPRPKPAQTDVPDDQPESGGSPITPPKGPKRDPEPRSPNAPPSKPPPAVRNPPDNVRPELTADRYVFPVYGPSSFSNDFAASRAITGWHHGNDIFAPYGAPVLAVTDGTLFLTGWNDVGGNRVWLRDREGNEFYFAHLSAFSPLAFNGSQVRAGDVIGFVGTTGDAQGTPPHLHFEIHPAALLGLGYDGVVNPYEYLLAWHQVADRAFDWGSPDAGEAPPPATVLLQSEDISTASGLDPDALTELLELPAFLGEPEAARAPTVVGAGPGL
jgi:murein DD-endopeptidase MepM/ murein hydrolase activator NlpD